MTGQWL
jgi:hypothetical protein